MAARSVPLASQVFHLPYGLAGITSRPDLAEPESNGNQLKQSRCSGPAPAPRDK
jgi:hypothetical protein